MPSCSCGEVEHVVPQPRLEVALHLGQVEVGPSPLVQQLLRVVEEVQPEVDEGARPPARPSTVRCRSSRCQPRGRGTIVGSAASVTQLVLLALGLVNAPCPGRVVQVDLAADDVAPVRRVGVLEVGQPDLRAGVERVDRHLALGRPGDLDPPVQQVGGARARPASRRRGRPRSRAGSPAARSGRPLRGGPDGAASSSSRRSANRSWSRATKASASVGEDLLGPLDGRTGNLDCHQESSFVFVGSSRGRAA